MAKKMVAWASPQDQLASHQESELMRANFPTPDQLALLVPKPFVVRAIHPLIPLLGRQTGQPLNIN
jgi:hypothetical protein